MLIEHQSKMEEHKAFIDTRAKGEELNVIGFSGEIRSSTANSILSVLYSRTLGDRHTWVFDSLMAGSKVLEGGIKSATCAKPVESWRLVLLPEHVSLLF